MTEVLTAWPGWMFVVLLGLSFGSFTNVLICRLPANESIWRQRSRCPECRHPLRWYHNVPVLSFVFLRGRCGFCRTAISPVYPIVELVCTGLFVLFYAQYGVSLTTLGFWYLSVVLLAVFFIDLKHRIIPNVLTYSGVVVGIAVAAVASHMSVLSSVIGAAVGFGVFLGMAYLGSALFKKDALGGGDIKLAAVLGAFLGVERLLLVVILSAVIGLVVSIVAMAVSKALREDRTIPFGPFLALAAVIAAIYGDAIIGFYIAHFLS